MFSRGSVAAIALSLFSLFFLVSGMAWALPEDGQKFKDWTAKCEINPNDPADKRCVVFQTIVESTQKKNVMNLVVAFPPDQPNGRVIVILPLGIDLRAGIEFSVDDGNPTQHPFIVCLKDGCQSHIPLEENLLSSLKKGSKGTIRFRALPNLKIVAIPVSLAGFTAAVGSLQ